MQCPNCEQLVDDNSNHCPNCGTALEKTFCAHCGQAIGAGSTRSSSSYLFFILFIALLLLITNTNRNSLFNDETREVSAPTVNQPVSLEKPYEVVYNELISFEDINSHEFKIFLKYEFDNNVAKDSVRQIIEDIRNINPGDIVVVYVYKSEKDVDKNPANYNLKATYVNEDLNPGFKTEILNNLEKLDKYTYLEWR